MGCCNSRQTDSLSRHKHGLVPPHLALRLARYVFEHDPLYAPDLPPRYSLECELIWRTVPAVFWSHKELEAQRTEDQLVLVRDQLKRGLGICREMKDMERELQERLTMLDMGFTILHRANYKFFHWLADHGITPEHGYQALEEYAEGAAGGLSMYWPDAARDACTEGALVRGDWVLARFDAQKEAKIGTRKLPPPQLAFLASDNPDYRSHPVPTPITVIPPRNPAARILGMVHCNLNEQPPPYISCDSREADTANPRPPPPSPRAPATSLAP